MLTGTFCVPLAAWSVGGSSPAIDPDVHALVRQGRARVLVELRVPGQPNRTAPRPEAIAAVRQRVLTRLADTRVSVARRYATVPLLALEIDADALAELERMGDLVIRVVPDGTARTSSGSSPTD
jgi:hypothetical protein